MLVGHAIRADKLQQRITEQIRVVAVVIPECHLIEVRGKVTGAQMVVRADDRPINICGLQLLAEYLIAENDRSLDALCQELV